MKQQTLCWLLEEEQTSTIEVTLPVGMKKKKLSLGQSECVSSRTGSDFVLYSALHSTHDDF